MKKQGLLLALLFSFAISYAQDKPKDWANFTRYREANSTAPRGAKAVFLGNSITDGWARQRPEFFTSNGYIGRGISGQVTSQMLVRFRKDVLDLQPKSVVILAGTNDIAQNNGYIALDDIFGNIVSMAELAKAHKIKVILCSVLPVYDYRWRPGLEPAEKIKTLNEMMRKYAEENKCTYVDYHSAMQDEHGGLPEKLAKDGVHPTPEGYRIMESIVKPAIDKAVGK